MSDETILIRNGTVIDGTGAPLFHADILIERGRIAEIFRDAAQIPPSSDVKTLDATGLYIAPGFIDIHSHSDFTLIADPARSARLCRA